MLTVLQMLTRGPLITKQPKDPRQLPRIERKAKIVAYLTEHGLTTTGTLFTELSYNVRKVLAEDISSLIKDGVITKVAHGKYQLSVPYSG